MKFRIAALAIALAFTFGLSAAHAEKAPLSPEAVTKIKKAVDRGLRYLRGHQEENGSYGQHVGLTGMTLLAFGESHRKYTYSDGPFVSRAADWLVKQARPDGAITGDATPTYNTALAIMGLGAMDRKRFDDTVKRGQSFLVRFQSDEDQQYAKDHKFYGGIGYGGDERPDLSNLHYALEALKKTDYDPNSDVWAKAQTFIERCQNRSESNDQEWAGNDGGFVYAPGQSPVGGTQSYGAMSFAGLKSLIFTKAKPDDPRVKAVWKWIRKNYDFAMHPGMGTASYFYYIQTAAEGLKAHGQINVPDEKGRPRNWVADLSDRMIALQRPDGSWVNENKKYWEGNPIMVTARSVVTLNNILRAAGALE